MAVQSTVDVCSVCTVHNYMSEKNARKKKKKKKCKQKTASVEAESKEQRAAVGGVRGPLRLVGPTQIPRSLTPTQTLPAGLPLAALPESYGAPCSI
jgi:hypothetical protein